MVLLNKTLTFRLSVHVTLISLTVYSSASACLHSGSIISIKSNSGKCCFELRCDLITGRCGVTLK